jgi:GT2 family glycosyltransferase
MNGNCVLIPHEVLTAVGNLDERFEHAMGDMDYGLRVTKAGFPMWVAPGHVGRCRRNPAKDTYLDAAAPLSKRMKHLLSRKGLPVRSWFVFTRRHAGPLWPLYWAWPYLKVVLLAALRR